MVNVCPKCKSTQLKNDVSIAAYGRGSIFNQRQCLNCGYAGIFFPDIEKKKTKKIKKEKRKKK